MCNMRFAKPSLMSCLQTFPQEHFNRFNSLRPATGLLPKESWQIFCFQAGLLDDHEIGGKNSTWMKCGYDNKTAEIGQDCCCWHLMISTFTAIGFARKKQYFSTYNILYNILQYSLPTIQCIAILLSDNTSIYCNTSTRYRQYNILVLSNEPTQYMVLSGRTSTIYCSQYIAI